MLSLISFGNKMVVLQLRCFNFDSEINISLGEIPKLDNGLLIPLSKKSNG